jgi:hypothetical protein
MPNSATPVLRMRLTATAYTSHIRAWASSIKKRNVAEEL